MTGGQSFIAAGDGPHGPAVLAKPAQVITDDRGRVLVAFLATGGVIGDKRAALSLLLSLPEPQRSLRDNTLSLAALHYSILAEELGGGRECHGAPSFGPLPGGPHAVELSEAFAVYRNIPSPQFRAFSRAEAERWAGRAAAADPLAYFTVVEARAAYRGGSLPQQEPEE